MGGSTYSKDEHTKRAAFRAATAAPVFKHDSDIKTGAVTAKVHDSLSPKCARDGVRESRDSVEHPVTLPIILGLDTTGSNREAARVIESKLSSLMGVFLNDKASGKKYLGDAYPAIMVAAVDDFNEMGGEGTLQVGQFESGIEIDNNLENLWLTGRGGGTYEESYQLLVYFAARHTAIDHWEKRGKKGYLILMGDEMAYPTVDPLEVKEVIGDILQAPVPFEAILTEVSQRYHVFFIIPNLSQHYGDKVLEDWWVKRIGQQNVIKLPNVNNICETIAGLVALNEEHVGLDDLVSDGVMDSAASQALVPLSRAMGGGMAKFSADNLPAISGNADSVERL